MSDEAGQQVPNGWREAAATEHRVQSSPAAAVENCEDLGPWRGGQMGQRVSEKQHMPMHHGVEHQARIDFFALGHGSGIAPRAPARFALANRRRCVVARIAQQPLETARLDRALDDAQAGKRLTNAFDKVQARYTGKIAALEQCPAHLCILAPFFRQQREVVLWQGNIVAAQNANAQIRIAQTGECQSHTLAQRRSGGHYGQHIGVARTDDAHQIGIEQHGRELDHGAGNDRCVLRQREHDRARRVFGMQQPIGQRSANLDGRVVEKIHQRSIKRGLLVGRTTMGEISHCGQMSRLPPLLAVARLRKLHITLIGDHTHPQNTLEVQTSLQGLSFGSP